MMTETMTVRKTAQYIVPGERLAHRDANQSYLVTDIRRDDEGVHVTTDKGVWTVAPDRVVTVETSPELDPFAGLEDIPAEPPLREADRATAKQVAFLTSLREERDVFGRDPAGMTKREASEEIDRLLKQPPVATRGATSEPVADVPAGRYALDKLDGGAAFYQVDRPTEGRWAGYCFVKLLIGAPGDWRKERVGNWRSIVSRIAEAGPREAAIRFGMESGYCGRCGSPLSNEESLRLGIGPVCRDKAGW